MDVTITYGGADAGTYPVQFGSDQFLQERDMVRVLIHNVYGHVLTDNTINSLNT